MAMPPISSAPIPGSSARRCRPGSASMAWTRNPRNRRSSARSVPAARCGAWWATHSDWSGRGDKGVLAMSDGVMAQGVKVEEKLFQNRYLVDAGRPHIKVRPHEKPSAGLLAMTHLCPAGCYATNEAGQVEVSADGCVECGTCRIVTQTT